MRRFCPSQSEDETLKRCRNRPVSMKIAALGHDFAGLGGQRGEVMDDPRLFLGELDKA